MEKFIWVFGNAVQDITLDLIDIDRLIIEYENISRKIRLDGYLKLADQLWIKTRKGIDRFAAEIKFNNKDPSKTPEKDSTGKFYLLRPGRKYDLSGSVQNSFGGISKSSDSLFIPCENILWGGGGLNCTTFMRSLVPNSKAMPITYTDVAMSKTLPDLIRSIQQQLRRALKTGWVDKYTLETIHDEIDKLTVTKPNVTEKLSAEIASIFSKYSPLHSLEVYLASLPVNPLLYRPKEADFRRNFVFTRVRSATHSMNDKIICKGKSRRLDESETQPITNLLNERKGDFGAIVFNSIADKPMFNASYEIYKKALDKNENVVGIFSMTKTMQGVFSEITSKKRNGRFPPFILVFNEKEAFEFAKLFNPNVERFIEYPGDMPNIGKFIKISRTIRKQFVVDEIPRIYVTIGDRGSIGVERDGRMIYIWRFSKPGAVIYDTNACGDAYCAAIAVLEWAKRSKKYRDIACVDMGNPDCAIHEMRYFMGVATATAYAKATNRRGRVDSTEVSDLLQHGHLASSFLPDDTAIKKVLASKDFPDWVGHDHRLKIPVNSQRLGVTPVLSRLLGDYG